MRDRTKLHPILQYKIEQLIKLCEQNGLKIGIGECTRTVQEQNNLYAQGRTKPGNKVTNAKGSDYGSMHQWGVAFDFYRNDGKGAYNESGDFFGHVGRIGKSIGLEWGGAWTSIKDKPHFQLPYWCSTPKQLKAKYVIPERFADYWYPNKPTSTVKQGSSRDDVLWVQIQICKLTRIILVPDGIFGPKTADAILQYQRMLGWDGTGKAGTKTIAALAKSRIK